MPADLPKDTRFVGLEDIAQYDGIILNYSQVSNIKSRVYKFENGDVLYGRLRPYLRKAAVSDFSGAASTEIIVLRCSDRILSRYLLMLLLSEEFNQFVSARSKGDRPRVSFETLATYRIDLPTIEVQAEVCDRDAKLLAAMSMMTEACQTHERATGQLLEVQRSSLIWGGGIEADRVPLSDLVESIDYGTTKRSTYGAPGIPVLRIPNLIDGSIDANDLKYAPLNSAEMDRYRLHVGDILLIRSNGSLAMVGQAAIVAEEQQNFAFAGYLLRMRPKKGVSSEYLLEVLRSTPFRRMVAAAARSSTGINNLSAGRLAAFSIPIAPIKRQSQIVAKLARLYEAVARSNAALVETRQSANLLQKTARQGWLGQNVSAARATEKASDIDKKSDNTPEERTMLPMDESIETILMRRIETFPAGVASFESMVDGIRADYDELRDAIFALLMADPPRLEQIFDKKSRSILLRRPL